METDINKVLRTVLSTGKAVMGGRQTKTAIKNGKVKVIVLSSNCPEQIKKEIKDVPVIDYRGTGVDLGVACGKPFSIAVLAVLEPGESEILTLRSMNV